MPEPPNDNAYGKDQQEKESTGRRKGPEQEAYFHSTHVLNHKQDYQTSHSDDQD